MGELVCWKCGADLSTLPQPLARRAECLACHAELHVCRMCRHYDPGKAKQCREPMAEEVADKGRANFCDWFQARADAYQPPAGHGQASEHAKRALDALFDGGEAAAPSQDTKAELDRLFGK